MKILLADDDPDHVTLLRLFLEGRGHTVLTANSGSAALTLARRDHPGIVILDVGMPGMSGTDVAAAIRREPWGENIFMIAVTGWCTAEDRMATTWAGFDEHLSKPVSIEDIEQLVEAHHELDEHLGELIPAPAAD